MSRAYRRIGFIGDIHGEHERLERALDLLASRGVQLVVATGDVADGPGSVERCVELLESRNVVVVRGNHDRWAVAGTARDLPDATPLPALSGGARRWLAELPPMVEFDTSAGRALLCHGLGPNDLAKVIPDDFGYAIETNEDLQKLLRQRTYRWVLNGHSHRRMVRHFGDLTLINAGTLLRHHDPGFFELDFDEGRGVHFSYDPSGRVDSTTEEIALRNIATTPLQRH